MAMHSAILGTNSANSLSLLAAILNLTEHDRAMYENGAGVAVDLRKAISLYEQAKRNGSAQAGMRLLQLS